MNELGGYKRHPSLGLLHNWQLNNIYFDSWTWMLTWTYNSNSTFSIKLPRPCYDWQEFREMLGRWSEKIRIMWEKFPSGRPPPPPFWEFSDFFYRFLPFNKPLNWKKQKKVWSGFGSDPSPPLWEFFPHNPVFFLTTFLTTNCNKYGWQFKRNTLGQINLQYLSIGNKSNSNQLDLLGSLIILAPSLSSSSLPSSSSLRHCNQC